MKIGQQDFAIGKQLSLSAFIYHWLLSFEYMNESAIKYDY